MPTSPIQSYSGAQCIPLKNPSAARQFNAALAEGTYLAGQILGEKSGVKEVQTLATASGTITAGTFTLTFGGQTTAAIAWNASAAAVEDALELLSTIGTGGVIVAGGPLPGTGMTITFQTPGDKGNITVDNASLTGGTLGLTNTTAGTAGTPGTFGKYDEDNTDGTQNPTAILQYSCVVDSSGNVWIGDTSGASEWGVSNKFAPMWRNGLFATQDLVGLDDNAVAKLGRIVRGNLQNGELAVYGS